MSVSPPTQEPDAFEDGSNGTEDGVKVAPLKGSAAARLVPQSRLTGPIPWVIAIMIALVVIAAAGGLALRNLAENARSDLSGAATVQIVEANQLRRAQLSAAAAEVLADQSIVASIRVVPEEELGDMLEPWLGSGAGGEDLPIPALIDVQLAGASGPEQIAQLQNILDASVPGARVDAQSDWLQPVYSALSALQYLALGLIVLLALACTAAVWLAARSAFASHRDTVEIIHLLGGTDGQVTRIFQRSVARDAAFGGLAGLIMGIAAVWLLGGQFSELDGGLVAGGGLSWGDWAIIVAIPLIGIGLALLTGWITIMFGLRKML
ncbi:MAG: FtsX-like permease family protein [Erythrobacter sp.]